MAGTPISGLQLAVPAAAKGVLGAQDFIGSLLKQRGQAIELERAQAEFDRPKGISGGFLRQIGFGDMAPKTSLEEFNDNVLNITTNPDGTRVSNEDLIAQGFKTEDDIHSEALEMTASSLNIPKADLINQLKLERQFQGGQLSREEMALIPKQIAAETSTKINTLRGGFSLTKEGRKETQKEIDRTLSDFRAFQSKFFKPGEVLKLFGRKRDLAVQEAKNLISRLNKVGLIDRAHGLSATLQAMTGKSAEELGLEKPTRQPTQPRTTRPPTRKTPSQQRRIPQQDSTQVDQDFQKMVNDLSAKLAAASKRKGLKKIRRRDLEDMVISGQKGTSRVPSPARLKRVVDEIARKSRVQVVD